MAQLNDTKINGTLNLTDQATVTKSSGDTYFVATRSDKDTSIKFGIGSGGTNRGVYDTTKGQWIFYTSNAITYMKSVSESAYLLNKDGGGVSLFGTSPAFTPMSNGSVTLGTGSYRWGQVYSTASSISTSDRNLKKDFTEFDERYEKLFLDLKPTLYKFKDGTSDRLHSGFISQDIEDSLAKYDLTALDFAGFCKDKVQEDISEKGEERVLQDKLDENGDPIYEYSLRYEEFIALNTHMLQKAYKKIEEQEAKINKLENRLTDLENELHH